MFQVRDLSKSYPDKILLNRISFSINKGEKCALLGRNGSGKTTLFKILCGEENADEGAIILPKDYKIGYLKQHICFSAPTVLEEAVLGLPLAERECSYKAEKILFGLGFSETAIHHSPHNLSGGYQLRLNLVKLLLSNPDCLLLDEPTNFLDIVSISWLKSFLRQWQNEVILISHDRDFLDHICTHTLGIHRGKIIKVEGGTQDYYDRILQEEEIYERTRISLEKKKQHLENYIERFGAKASKASQAQSKMKQLKKIPSLEALAKIDDLCFEFKEIPFAGVEMMKIKDISFSYAPTSEESAQWLIKDFNLSICRGDRIAVIGKNGRGKSTLLKILAQECIPQKGSIKLSEASQCGYFGQTNIERLHPSLSIEEEIHSANPMLNSTQIRTICGVMMFGQDSAKKKIAVLSGGERSRVLLGKLVAQPCNLLFLDEPTNHLDVESIESLMMALDSFNGAVVIVTHSEAVLKRLSINKIIACSQDKQNYFEGDYDLFLEKIGWELEVHKTSQKQDIKSVKSRQKRAEMIQARSKACKPFEVKIQFTENQICEAEVDIEQMNNQLVEASAQQDSKAIQSLSKSLDQKQKLVETLFAELETLYRNYEDCKNNFPID